ncbi:TPA: hypothetical protein HA265_03110 [Candidatus Woesearchaeota archaeon]|nr:hypothetical protein [Candidatus Woesearchaeota archaeon]
MKGRASKKRGKKEGNAYLDSYRKTWKKETIYYTLADLGTLLFFFVALGAGILIFRGGYFEFISAAPAFQKSVDMMQTQGSEILGLDMNLLEAQISTAKQATYFAAKRLGIGALVFVLLASAGCAMGNAYLWARVKNEKITIKKLLNMFYMNLIITAVWLFIFFFTLAFIRTSYILLVLISYIFTLPFTYQIAYSYTTDSFLKTLKYAFTRPFIKIHHYALAIILQITTLVAGFNLTYAIFDLTLFRTPLMLPAVLALVVLVLVWMTLVRHHFHNLQIKLGLNT